MSSKKPGAYGVRYLFVILAFSIVEMVDLTEPFSWVEPSSRRGPNPFDTRLTKV
jgi:hypothetical protein